MASNRGKAMGMGKVAKKHGIPDQSCGFTQLVAPTALKGSVILSNCLYGNLELFVAVMYS